MLIAAGAGLAALALFVTFGLPDVVAPPAPGPAPAPVSVPAAPPVASAPAAPSVPDPDAAEAERLLSDALRRIARLEGEGVRQWGGDVVQGVSFPAAEEAMAKATALHDGKQHGEALPLFRQAIEILDRLSETKPERLRHALAAGRAALQALDAAVAQRHFEIAAALAPGDAPTAALLERARKLPQTLAAFRRGESAEAGGELERAREAYRETASLDPEFEAVRAPLRRVEAALTASEYRRAVSEALARLGEGNIRAAEAALERARRLNPQAPELADIRQRVQAAAQVASLERLRGQAAALERQEKWAEVVKAYDQALAVDRTAAFAANGRERAQRLTQLHAAIDTYLADPARLQSADPLAHARTLLAQAVAPEDEGPLLTGKRRQLTQLIATAQAPLPVLLRSDRNTDVVVQRVARLGSFETHRLELPPGRYVAVGSRPGYRDVRVSFEVSPAAKDQPPVTIQCTEPIR